MLIGNPLLAIVFLLGGSILSGTITALLQMGRLASKEEFQRKPALLFYLRFLYGEKLWQGSLFSIGLTKLILQLCYALLGFLYLTQVDPFSHALPYADTHTATWNLSWIACALIVIIAIALCAEFLTTLFAIFRPKFYLKIAAPIASFFLFLLSPLTVLFLKGLQKSFLTAGKDSKSKENSKLRDKILEILYESDLSSDLDPNDQKLILSVASFKEKIAREVMVPRINMFCLAAETSIKEAAQSFLKEGYSRIPIYKERVDNVIGVLLYKDVLKIYASQQLKDGQKLDTPVENFVKPILYTPETKRISHLLQEFRSKQLHLAIVVDEYGGTEGIVTIEDILEELVGEIADEYDIGEETLYSELPTGGWIVDARMNILDIEEELGIKIPSSPEYDTLGGYIFHRAGAIPLKGWKIHLNEYDLEVISSNERSVEKVKIQTHEE
jgi:CBS domain containing-hemolysin-like protein